MSARTASKTTRTLGGVVLVGLRESADDYGEAEALFRTASKHLT